MITAILILCVIIALIKWIKADRKYKEAKIKAMDTPGPVPNDTTRTVRIKKRKKLNRIQWMGDGRWKYWVEDRPDGYIPQTYEYDHKKPDGVDYLVIVEDS